MALGVFDGVHIGHRYLFEETVQTARQAQLRAAVFTICDAFSYKKTLPLLSEAEKHARMEMCGIERVYTVRFAQIAHLSPQAFVKDVLIDRLGCEVAICGENFRFGKGAAGTAQTLCELMLVQGLRTSVVPSILHEGKTVSSSAIKEALAQGCIERANAMLGAPYTLSAPVVHGKGIGAAVLGVPTINQCLDADTHLPKKGVYVSMTKIKDKSFRSVTNIGCRPTLEKEGLPNAETHILAQTGDLYGKEIAVSLYAFLRDERCFASKEALKAQLERDCASARSYHLKT